MKIYQIELGPMLWDIDNQEFRNIDRWDGDGSHIQEKDLAAQVEAVKSKSENVWGWEIKIIEPEEKIKVTVYTSEGLTRSENVNHSDAASHVAAGGSYSTEAEVLLAFIESDDVPLTIMDRDGDSWELETKGSQGGESFYTYVLQS